MKKFISYSDRIAHCSNPLAEKLLSTMMEKQSNLAFSADITRAKELLTLLDKIGPEICLLKTHVDILDDFSSDFVIQLKQLAEKHRFLIFEDRKFADIGHTVKLQYQSGIYRISDWADIINAHSLPGPGIIKCLREIGLPKQRGLLLLAEMSSENNLCDASYSQKTLALAENFNDFVIGFITRKKLSPDPRWLYFTPGIQFHKKNDGLDQQYISPEEAIAENGSDVIIVGRGISRAEDPAAAAKTYREAGWKAYLSRL